MENNWLYRYFKLLDKSFEALKRKIKFFRRKKEFEPNHFLMKRASPVNGSETLSRGK